MFSTLFLLFPIFAFGSCSDIVGQEKRILDNILGSGSYDSRIRPPGENGTGPVYIETNVFVRSISRIDDVVMEYSTQLTFRLKWRDHRLVYDDLGGQIKYLTLADSSLVWPLLHEG